MGIETIEEHSPVTKTKNANDGKQLILTYNCPIFTNVKGQFQKDMIEKESFHRTTMQREEMKKIRRMFVIKGLHTLFLKNVPDIFCQFDFFSIFFSVVCFLIILVLSITLFILVKLLGKILIITKEFLYY